MLTFEKWGWLPDLPEMEDDGFETFWAGYPKKQAKKDASKAWRKLRPSVQLQQTINDSVQEHARTKQWREGYIPLAGTFIRGARWEDELDPRRDFLRAKL